MTGTPWDKHHQTARTEAIASMEEAVLGADTSLGWVGILPETSAHTLDLLESAKRDLQEALRAVDRPDYSASALERHPLDEPPEPAARAEPGPRPPLLAGEGDTGAEVPGKVVRYRQDSDSGELVEDRP